MGNSRWASELNGGRVEYERRGKVSSNFRQCACVHTCPSWCAFAKRSTIVTPDDSIVIAVNFKAAVRSRSRSDRNLKFFCSMKSFDFYPIGWTLTPRTERHWFTLLNCNDCFNYDLNDFVVLTRYANNVIYVAKRMLVCSYECFIASANCEHMYVALDYLWCAIVLMCLFIRHLENYKGFSFFNVLIFVGLIN